MSNSFFSSPQDSSFTQLHIGYCQDVFLFPWLFTFGFAGFGGNTMEPCVKRISRTNAHSKQSYLRALCLLVAYQLLTFLIATSSCLFLSLVWLSCTDSAFLSVVWKFFIHFSHWRTLFGPSLIFCYHFGSLLWHGNNRADWRHLDGQSCSSELCRSTFVWASGRIDMVMRFGFYWVFILFIFENLLFSSCISVDFRFSISSTSDIISNIFWRESNMTWKKNVV